MGHGGPVHSGSLRVSRAHGHSNWCKVIPHCSFDLHFSNHEQCWASSQVFVDRLYLSQGGRWTSACYKEWSKSEREKQIQSISPNIWNLEKWYWWTHLQGKNRDADTEKLVNTAGKDRVGQTERVTLKQTLPCVKQIASGNLLYKYRELKPLFCDNLEEWDGVWGEREAQEEGNSCIFMADSCCCVAETNITL